MLTCQRNGSGEAEQRGQLSGWSLERGGGALQLAEGDGVGARGQLGTCGQVKGGGGATERC